jgi:hypothetical protein
MTSPLGRAGMRLFSLGNRHNVSAAVLKACLQSLYEISIDLPIRLRRPKKSAVRRANQHRMPADYGLSS